MINIGGVPFLHGFSKGNQNVFVGGAGNFTTTGTATAATGFGALAAQTSGKNNTAAGADALANVTTGSSNTGVGVSAGPTGGALSNTTAVGANAKVGQSNSLVLGNTNSTPGAKFVNVGIGTETPASILEASVNVSSALGPTLTLTNPGGARPIRRPTRAPRSRSTSTRISPPRPRRAIFRRPVSKRWTMGSILTT